MDKILKTIFTREMHQFLIEEGYTHVLNKGVVELDEKDVDQQRIKEWNSQLKLWYEQGLSESYFFIHSDKMENSIQFYDYVRKNFNF